MKTKCLKAGIIASVLLGSILLNSVVHSLTNSFLTINCAELTVVAILVTTVYLISINKVIQIPKYSLYFCLLLLYFSIIAAFSKYSTYSFYYHILLIFLIYLILIKVYNHNILNLLYILFAVIGFYEALDGLTTINKSSIGLGITGHFNNQAGFSVTVASLIPYSLFLIKHQKKYIKIFGIVAALLMIFAIVLKSRAGIVATIFCLFLLFLIRFKITLRKLQIKYIIILLIIGVIFTSVASYYLYKSKIDSANGRLLIWHCTIDMIKDKPLFGHGTNSFEAKYMLYQAEYFKENQHNKYAYLADNVSRPYNEYLNIILQYGIVGFMFFILFFGFLARICFKNCSENNVAPAMSLISILIFAFFSFPFSFPTILILLTINTFIILQNNKYYYISSALHKACLLAVILGILVYTIFLSISHYNIEERWLKNQYPVKSINIPAFERLANSTYLSNNPFFLYNYGAVLNANKYYFESINVLLKCHKKLNDSDVSILLADNYFKLCNYKEAEKWALLASHMCPNRFVPLYYLVMVYSKTDRLCDAIDLSIEIINKPVKVHTEDVYKVKLFAKEFLNENVGLPKNLTCPQKPDC